MDIGNDVKLVDDIRSNEISVEIRAHSENVLATNRANHIRDETPL